MKTLKIVLKVFYNILFVLLLVSASFIILTSYKVIKGYNFYVVMSGSMEPSIHTGSVVGTNVEDAYKVDEVITMQMENDRSQTYTHRIVNVEDKDGDTIYVTKGDANESIDPDKSRSELVLGKVFISIPLIGYIVNFAKQPTGFLLMIIAPTIIIIASEANIVKEEVKKKLDEKKEKKVVEKEEIKLNKKKKNEKK